MKKLIAIAASLILMLGLSVTAFAYTSPGGTTYHKVVLVMNETAKPSVHTVSYTAEKDADALTFTAQKSADADVFLGWAVYKKDGTPAILNTDYFLIAPGSTTGAALTEVASVEFAGQTLLTDTSISIVAKTDLIVAANWNDTLTDIKAAKTAFDSTSVKTGDAAAAVLVGIAAVALTGVVISKKRLAQ